MPNYGYVSVATPQEKIHDSVASATSCPLSRVAITTICQEILYYRLGGYDGISAFANELLSRLRGDSQLGRFWQNRGEGGIAREKQLLIDFLCTKSGGPMYYTGRDMLVSHKGMKISEDDWSIFLNHAGATMEHFQIAKQECDDVVSFVLSLKDDMVEA